MTENCEDVHGLKFKKKNDFMKKWQFSRFSKTKIKKMSFLVVVLHKLFISGVKSHS